MSVAKVLEMAQIAGISIIVDGTTLLLQADATPPGSILDAIKMNKAGIIAFLSSEKRIWSHSDWLDYFEERAAIAEYDGGLSRAEAESMAFDCCINEWLNQNGVYSTNQGSQAEDALREIGLKSPSLSNFPNDFEKNGSA